MASSKQRFQVDKMKCNGCVATVRDTASKVPGVVSAEVDLKTGTAVVEGDFNPQAVADALTNAGYPASLED